MFTGIIEVIGVIRSISHGAGSCRITVGAEKVTGDIRAGDSICTDGVCLTVTSFGPGWFALDVMPETMRRTGLAGLKAGSRVNLERALKLSDRLGGHLVSGHVDGTGKITRKWAEDNAVWFRVETEAGLMRYIADKGSVAIDGISLTVAGTDARSFCVSVIPHTRQVTTLTGKNPGDTVNIEGDIIAKYLEKLTATGGSGSKIDLDFLAKNNFL